MMVVVHRDALHGEQHLRNVGCSGACRGESGRFHARSTAMRREESKKRAAEGIFTTVESVAGGIYTR